MQIDYQMLRTLEWLAERPLEYEPEHPIRAIERAISCGLAEASAVYRTPLQGRWRTVQKVKVSEYGATYLK